MRMKDIREYDLSYSWLCCRLVFLSKSFIIGTDSEYFAIVTRCGVEALWFRIERDDDLCLEESPCQKGINLSDSTLIEFRQVSCLPENTPFPVNK